MYVSTLVQPAIYKITCAPTGRVYVGSTVSAGDRWRAHQQNLQGSRHSNRFLQFAWDKYGQSAFSFEVVETNFPETQMATRERAWITRLNTWAPIGFNLADPVNWREQAAKVYVVTHPLGDEQQVLNLNRFCREQGIGASAPMVMVAQGLKPSHRGWKCRYAGESKKVWAERIARLRAKRKACNTCNRNATYLVTDPTGHRHKVDALWHWCRARNLDTGCMQRVAKGLSKSHKGHLVAFEGPR